MQLTQAFGISGTRIYLQNLILNLINFLVFLVYYIFNHKITFKKDFFYQVFSHFFLSISSQKIVVDSSDSSPPVLTSLYSLLE